MQSNLALDSKIGALRNEIRFDAERGESWLAFNFKDPFVLQKLFMEIYATFSDTGKPFERGRHIIESSSPSASSIFGHKA